MINDSRAIKAILGIPWCITEEGLMQVISIAMRQNLDVDKAMEIMDKRQENFYCGLGNVERLSGTRSVVVNENGVAVLPIFGPLMRRVSLFSAMSGAMSLEMIERDLLVAYESKNVNHIMADIDSPGGATPYLVEVANTIKSLRGGSKRLEAYSAGTIGSAAYWLGTSFDKLTIAPTAFAGSVGCIATFVDDSKLKEKLGIEDIEIVSSVSPDKNPDPATPEGKAKIQALVDSLGELFVSAVSSNLSLDRKTVLSWKGWIKVGEEAKKAGMVHDVAFRSDLLNELGGKKVTAVAPSLPAPSELDVDEDDLEALNAVEVSSVAHIQNNSDTIENNHVLGENIMTQENGNAIDPQHAQGVGSAILSALGLGGRPAAETQPQATVVPTQATNLPLVRSEADKARDKKMADLYVASVKDRVLPAAQTELAELYAEATALGIGDKVEAFVSKIRPHNMTTDLITTDIDTNAVTNELTTVEANNGQEDFGQLDANVSAHLSSQNSSPLGLVD